MDIGDRKLILKLFWQNEESFAATRRRFCTLRGIKRLSDGPSEMVIRNHVIKFDEYGTIMDLPKCGRPAITSEDVDRVEAIMDELRAEGI